MLTLFTCAVLALAPVQDEEPPSPERVEAAVEALEEALRGKDPAAKLAAIEAHEEVEAAPVAKLLARAVRDSDRDVRKRALSALRWMKHEESLDQLHSIAKRDKKLAEDEELLALLYRAIGQHRSPDSVALLSSNLFDTEAREVLRARILSLGHIRSKDSVEALIRAMHLTRRQVVQASMGDIRLALMVLTATDRGTSQDLWMDWWNENRRTFEVAEEAPKLPPDEDVAWKSYWGYEYELARDKRRRKRGSDPERR